MVVVEFEYNDFKALFGVSKEKVIETLSEMGAPTEVDPETGKLFAEVTPNRPDWYSVLGLARALHSYSKNKTNKYGAEKGEWKIIVDKKVSKIRPCTVGAVVKGLKLDDIGIRDMVVLQEKLLQTLGRGVKRFGIGLYPLEKIKFPVRYTTMKPEEIVYRPLDFEKAASAKEILKTHPKGQAYGKIISENAEYPVYVDADNKVLALIPVVNSEETGRVTESTRDVFVEATGMDQTGINQALNILVCHLIDLGGKAYSVEIEQEGKKENPRTPDLGYKKMTVTEEEIEKTLGVKIKKTEVNKLLARMGYEVEGKAVLAPPYRADILGPVDVIEDVAIAYGYNNFKPTTPDFFYPGKRSLANKKIGEIMRQMGFAEIVTPVLTSTERLKEFDLGGTPVLNPKTIEYTTIRSAMLPSILEIVVKNKMKGLPQKFYEIGRIYDKKEKQILSFALVDKNIDFSTARGQLQTLFRENEKKFALEPLKCEFFEQPYSASVIVNGKIIGLFGQLSKKLAEKNGLEHQTYLCQLEISSLL